MSILNKSELVTLKEKAVYWREVFQRDNLLEHRVIAHHELISIIELLTAEKILHIINAYVNRIIDEDNNGP